LIQMFRFYTVCALIAVCSAVVVNDPQRQFNQFKSDFNKVYASTEIEAQRLAIFTEKLAWIAQHNAEYAQGTWTYTVGINQFSDLTVEEFKAQYMGVKFNRTTARNDIWLTSLAEPNDVDWRTAGAVTPIKDQGQCGSCWAFSTTGSVEGAWQIAGNTLVSLSEQELCDCSRAYGNEGCSGGLMYDAFKYIIANGGIDSEADYGYLARDETCNTAKEQNKVAHISSFADVPANNEAQLVAAITKQPVSVAIEADQPSFQGYRSGVFNGPCGTNLDHGVLAVGYTDTYFIVKNSWGVGWGDQGYILMARNAQPPYGICGINMAASYPLVGSAPPSPSPPPPPSPPPSPPGPAKWDYEDPVDGSCHSYELNVQVEGLAGDFCSPPCSNTSPCSTNYPSSIDPSTTGQCVLEMSGQSQPTQCALICQPGTANACPANASCKPIQGIGLCTYDD